MEADDLASRIAALEAKDDVRRVVADYCATMDALAGTTGLPELFTEDAVLRGPAGEVAGRDAIVAYYHAFFDGPTVFSRHHVTNQTVEVLSSGQVRHRAAFLAFLGRDDESRIVFGTYDDTLVRTGEGWRFSRKVNDVVASTTSDAGWAQAFGSTKGGS